MKKLFTILPVIAALFLSSQVNAQYKSFLGVDLGFATTKDVSTSFNIGPTYGYVLNDMMQVVVGVNFRSETTKGGANDQKETGFGAGAEFRYGMNPSDNLYLFAALGGSFHSDKDDQGTSSDTDDIKDTGFTVGIRPGLQYHLSDRWSMEAHFGLLGLHSATTEVGSTKGDAVNTFGLDLSMSSLNYGLFFHF